MGAPSNESKEWGEEPEGSAAAKRFPLWAKVAIAACVLAIPCLGLLATLVVPGLVRELSQAKQRKAMVDIAAILDAVDSFTVEHGDYPESLEVLMRPDADGHVFLKSETVPVDPWGRPYRYEQLPDATAFRIFSLGRDGKPGGEGEDGDLDNSPIHRR